MNTETPPGWNHAQSNIEETLLNILGVETLDQTQLTSAHITLIQRALESCLPNAYLGTDITQLTADASKTNAFISACSTNQLEHLIELDDFVSNVSMQREPTTGEQTLINIISSISEMVPRTVHDRSSGPYEKPIDLPRKTGPIVQPQAGELWRINPDTKHEITVIVLEIKGVPTFVRDVSESDMTYWCEIITPSPSSKNSHSLVTLTPTHFVGAKETNMY